MQYQISSEILVSEEDSKQFARKICSLVKPSPFLVCLYGDLGAGKTFISREIIKFFLGDKIIVSSPTFSLLNIYSENNFTIYHYDLYRLKTIDEIYELSMEDALDNYLTLIEWPEIIEDILPQNNRINIEITYNSDNIRRAKLIALREDQFIT